MDCAPGTHCAEEKVCASLLPWGAECTAARECSEELGCHSGICKPAAGEGEPCEPGFFTCDVFRDRCDETLRRCVPSSVLGEPCSADGPGGECVGTTFCEDGLCRPLPNAGEPCVDGRCLGSLRCNASSLRCEPPVAPPERCP